MNFSEPSRAEPLPIAGDSARALAISPKGDRLVYTRETVNSTIWAIETPRMRLRMSQNHIPKPWITSSWQESAPQFSPDGRQIAFQSTRSGWSEIWVADRDGSHPRQLSDLRAAVAGCPHWSPDGKKIVFHSRHQINASLFVVDVSGGRPMRLSHERSNEFFPSWSHDGKWIYFTSRRSGDRQVWKMPATGGPATRITKNGGWAPLESADARDLYYAKFDRSEVWRMPITGGEEQKVLSNVAVSGSSYALSSSGIYFVAVLARGLRQQVAFLSFADGKTLSLADVQSRVETGISISADEQLLLYPQIDQRGSDLMLVENFH